MQRTQLRYLLLLAIGSDLEIEINTALWKSARTLEQLAAIESAWSWENQCLDRDSNRAPILKEFKDSLKRL